MRDAARGENDSDSREKSRVVTAVGMNGRMNGVDGKKDARMKTATAADGDRNAEPSNADKSFRVTGEKDDART
jgi:hypothetical protein